VTNPSDGAATPGRPPNGGPVRPATPPPALPGYGPPQPGYGPPPPGYGPPPPGYRPPYQHGYGPPPVYRPEPPPLAPDGRPLADFGTRLLAYLIDSAIVSAVTMVVALPAVFLFFSSRTNRFIGQDPTFVEDDPGRFFTEVFGPILLLEAGLFAFVLVVYYIYDVEMMYRSGQTVGKRVMKIRVVPIAPGARLTRLMAVKRYVIQIPGGVFVPFFSWLDGLWQLWDKPYLQTLHDKVAQTVVIKVGP
jgi:uncharacterized RDD family membrane protein YckC